MKGVLSKVLIVIGILLILAAILWWAVAVPGLVKFPDHMGNVVNGTDQGLSLTYEGTETLYVNPQTGAPLPAGQEISLPLQITNKFTSLKDQYTSSKAVVQEDTIVTIGGQATPTISSVYVFDRKNLKNLKDDLSTYGKVTDPTGKVLAPGKVVDRTANGDSYYISFPFDTKSDQTYKVWSNEANTTYDVKFDKNEDVDKVALLNFTGGNSNVPLDAYYIQLQGLPASTTVGALKAEIKALTGIDLNAILAQVAAVLTPAQQAQLATLTDATPIPLAYTYSNTRGVGIEPKTGVISNDYGTTQTIFAGANASGPELQALSQIIAGAVAANPALAQQLLPLQSALSQPPAVSKVEFKQTADSVAYVLNGEGFSNAVKGTISRINVAKIYVPWALLIVGAIVLIIGLLTGGRAAPEEKAEEKA